MLCVLHNGPYHPPDLLLYQKSSMDTDQSVTILTLMPYLTWPWLVMFIQTQALPVTPVVTVKKQCVATRKASSVNPVSHGTMHVVLG